MKKYVVFCGIVAVLLLSLGISVKSCQKQRDDNKRLSANQTALLDTVSYYRTEAGLSAASVQVLTLTNAEFKRYNADLVKEAANIDLKVRRLESASLTAVETVREIITQWRDSIVYKEGRIDTIRCIEYRDPYLIVDACEVGDSIYGSLHTYDTIVQFVHRVPHKWLFFRWGTKAIRQEVVTKNPYSTVVFTEYIKLKRK